MHRTGSEHELLLEFIRLNRRTVLWKLDGLTEEQARKRVVGSHTTLLGIVNHLAHVERYWVLQVVGGRSVDLPWSRDNPDADWIIASDETIESVLDFYDAQIAMCDAVLEAQGDLGREIEVGDRRTSVRWVLLHLIEEIARHAGHADILREMIDETTGYFPAEPRWGS
ncbi:MAG: DinB family protein [Acidimicrobiia bacterium]